MELFVVCRDIYLCKDVVEWAWEVLMFDEFDEFGEVEAVQTLVSAVRYFRDSPFVTGDGGIVLPAGQADQVGAMMAEMSVHWSGFEGAVAGMYLLADAAEDRLRAMFDEGCEECEDAVEVIAGFMSVLLQFPRAMVNYVAGGLSSSEAATARELFDELGLEVPESEEE
jgi:hypothetical protein